MNSPTKRRGAPFFQEIILVGSATKDYTLVSASTRRKHQVSPWCCLAFSFGLSVVGPGVLQAQVVAPLPKPSAEVGSSVLLRDLIDQAVATYPSVRGRENIREAARYNLQSARWARFPTPSLSVDQVQTSSKDPTYEGDNRVVTMRLQQPLFTGGRIVGGIKSAKAILAASDASIEEAKLEVARQVVESYGDWLGAELKLRALRESEQTYQQLDSMILRRITIGTSPESDRTLVEGRYQQIVVQRQLAEMQAAVAIARLEQLTSTLLTGLHPDFTDRDVIDRSMPIDDLLSSAHATSPMLARLDNEIENARQEARITRSALMPDVSIRAERQYGNFSIANRPPANRIFLSVGTKFGAGLSNFAQTGAADSRRRAAEAERDLGVRQIDQQVTVDRQMLASLDVRYRSLQSVFVNATEIRTSWDRQFLAGRKTWIDVMNAAREEADARVQLADAQANGFVLAWRLALVTRGVNAITTGGAGD